MGKTYATGRKRSAKDPRVPIGGTVHANIQIQENLHEAMKTIRQCRHEMEGADVKLCRIYQEAVRMYVNAKPQQELLKNYLANGSKGLRKTA